MAANIEQMFTIRAKNASRKGGERKKQETRLKVLSASSSKAKQSRLGWKYQPLSTKMSNNAI